MQSLRWTCRTSTLGNSLLNHHSANLSFHNVERVWKPTRDLQGKWRILNSMKQHCGGNWSFTHHLVSLRVVWKASQGLCRKCLILKSVKQQCGEPSFNKPSASTNLEVVGNLRGVLRETCHTLNSVKPRCGDNVFQLPSDPTNLGMFENPCRQLCGKCHYSALWNNIAG